MRRQRSYNADTMTEAIGTAMKIRQATHRQGTPSGLGGAESVPMATETLTGHCLGCKKSQAFSVEGEDTLPNGALRKFGHCDAGHSMSHIVSGKKVA